MKQTEILTEEAKELITKLCNDVETAKSKIKEALDNAEGIQYFVDATSLKYEVMDFSKSLSTIPFYLETIKNCYALMNAITEKCLLAFKTKQTTFKPEAKLETNKENQEIKIGDRVKLKGDSNSPEMTVTRNISKEIAAQNGIKTNAGELLIGTDEDDILECSYFEPKEDGQESFNNGLKQYKFHKDALKKLTEVQSTNNQIT